ncbi:DNA polymerase III subunit gamma/tau [Microbacterium sp. BWT-B31]|uniref:DNA polymerase III subunit gamma/tau n=1 Tax=Microbacterium sp. BWT-B31 TaxID=3232072 RepID=UPI0035283EC6
MTTGRDDDALSWDGDDDPTLDVGGTPEEASEAASTTVLPDGFTAVGKGSETFAASSADTTAYADDEDAERTTVVADGTGGEASAPVGNAALIALGILGGIYLLYAIGWVIGGLRLRGTAQFLVSPVSFDVAMWLAAFTPVIWYATVYLLTRRTRAWVRFAWLAAGAVLLIPWPFLMIGAVGT